ncbi:jg7946 [Pararge aegeria aegeria]|uniref:Jg7946 protein n=1 Tax=Pararge aegeria aegeria TaxID=348720 RepID=A0A8S4SCF5_9NEOP|nr:jg7946 [Pararge aegeria aegeria]
MPFDFGSDPVNDQEMVVVICTVSKGDLPLSIQWYFNEKSLKSNANGVLLTNAKRTSQLTIESVTHHNQGNYTCAVKNQAGTTNHTAELYVNVPPQVMPFEFGEEPVNAQEMVLVTCTVVKGDQPLRLEWYFEENKIKPGDLGISLMNTKRASQLSIESVSHQNQGNYTCVVTNQAGTMNHTAQLFVNGINKSIISVAPIITPFEFDESVYFGEGVQVMCHVPKGDKPLSFKWSFSGGDVSLLPGVNIMNVGDMGSALIIPYVTAKHSGNYTCTASNIVARASHHASLNVKVPPHIVHFEAEEPVFAGESVQLNCHVSKGDAPLAITWSFHGKELSSHEGIMTTKIGQRTSLLTISIATASHSGEYSCHASNKAGLAVHSTTVNVHVVPNILPFDVDQALFSGESVQMMCHISKGDIPLQVYWEFNGHTLSRELGTFSKVGDRSSVLVLPSVTGANSGNYTCKAKNRAGVASYTTVLKLIILMFQLQVVPYIIPFEVEESIFAGESVHITCHVSKGDSPLQITWSFQGTEIPYHNNMGITTTKLGEKASVLSIPTAMGQHSGNYTCTASNRAGRAHHSALVNIHVPPHIMPFDIEESLFYGESVQMTCHASKGDRPMSITWTFEGQDLSTVSGIKTLKMAEQTSFLTIASITGAHSGNYTCIARNRAGEDRYTTTLHVNVVPHIKPFELDEAVFAGESVHLDCHVPKGDVPMNITWSFQGHLLTRRMGVKTTTLSERVSVLDIPSASGANSGNYTFPPNILPFSFGEKPANVGEYLQAACTVNFGDLPLTIAWTFNGHLISQRNNDYTMTNSKRSSLIIIESVDAKHAGSYTCTGENRAGRTTYSADLVVYVPPLVVPFSFGEVPSNPGDAAVVNCVATKGDLPLEISWTFSSETIDSSLHRDIMTTPLGPRASVLTINSVSANHQGNYTCIVQNAAGRAEYAATLVVNVPPRWILEPTDKAFAQGSDAKVECKADGFPKPQVTWKRAEGDTPGDYKDLKPNNPNVKVEDGTLMIANIQKTNEGYYLCEAVNGIGSGLSAVILISVQAPPQFEIKMRNQTARRSEPAVLQCQAKGEKPIGIIWNMNNKRLEPKSDPRYTIREEILPGGVVSDLSIRRTERSDSALFTCVATNAFGSDDTSINMIIQEVPEAPYGLKVLDKSGRTVQLSWAAPYDGNSPIKKFLIEYKRAKGNWEKDIDRVLVPGDATEAGVFSLRPATAYHIRIVAENELGTSEPSETVTIITAEEAPTGMPQDVKVDAVDKHTLRVTWKPPQPQDWNGELQGYYVGYKLASSNKSFVFETVDISKESGKEHHLDIFNLKTYTQYAIVVQAFNKMGSGPVSNEVRAYTAEGAPSAPPQDVLCTTLTAQTIRVSWVSPPLAAANGLIKAYKVIYGPSETWYDEKTKDTKITASSETILHGLKKFTNYSMEVLATTNGGDGVRSAPIHCQTEQDVPEAPRAVKALVMGADSILVSWRPPAQPNGVVTHYNVYTQAQNAEPHPNKVPASQTSYSATELKAGRYDFWVTASTIIGEGQPSATASCSASDKVPAKIASFDESFTATYKEDVKLPCLAVGVPPPNILWKVKGHPLEASERVRQLPEGSLQIAGVAREDAGEYSCHVDNQFGTDTVTHTLSVLAPPFPPQLSIASSSVSSLTLRLKPSLEAEQSPAAGYTIHYKQEFGDWETVQIPSNTDTYTLENLFCGSRYQLYVTAYNSIGTGEASDVVIARTRGSKPPVPRAADFIEVGSSSVTLHLKQWLDGGCPMSHFVVENKKKGAAEWNQISNAVKPGGNFVVLDLEPATWYVLRITAHNNAGFNVAEYEFATLTMTGGTIAPAREVGDGNLTPEQTLKIILSHLNLIVPVVAAILVIIIAIVVVCVVRGARDRHHKDDAVYNASGAALGAGGTLDKRGGLRDELGYIAPPNRKLPPVPGSNYNTCDRVKRQAVISMEDEICPYATFHLLGFREEMDPSKAIAFPHHHPSHAGTLAHPHQHPHHPAHSRAGSQSMPRANSRYARKNSQGGQSAIYSTAPEYDDPATCAEEDQYRARYSRPMYACGPEYDEPACCAPEDEQYTGAYGTPYSDHYGSRPSIGTRKCGSSPEPPPPPPRNANNNDNNCSSSFNESKDSNEISEAECDQPRNYPVRAHTAKDGLHSDEMRKLIDRPEANTPIPQQAVHGRGGLTAYDTVAV